MKTERLEMRLTPAMLSELDEWRRVQSDLPSRSEAFRRLVAIGLVADAALLEARSFIDEDSPDWRHAKIEALAKIDAAIATIKLR